MEQAWKQITWAEGRELYEAGVSIDCFEQKDWPGKNRRNPVPSTPEASYWFSYWDLEYPLHIKVE